MTPGLTSGGREPLTQGEAARRLGVHRNTIRNWFRGGVLTDLHVATVRALRVEMRALQPSTKDMLLGFKADRQAECVFCGGTYRPDDPVVSPLVPDWGHAECASAVGWSVYSRLTTRISQSEAAVDDRATAPEDFGPLNERFRFTLDVAALPHNAKLPRFYTPDHDGLERSWEGERVWCNPPYSHIEPWVIKAWWSRAELVVMLLPANRTEQGWWQRQIEPFRDEPGGVKVEFLPGRMRFIAHDADVIKPNERPPFGCCLAIWGGQ